MALQDFIIPQHYEILLRPDLKCFRCPGNVKINLGVTRPTNRIILNAKEITFLDVKITQSKKNDDEVIRIEKYCIDNSKGEVELLLPREVQGECTLEIEFESVINDKMAGLYRTTYTWRGKKLHAAVTQFEENDARRAFPCFDHPAKKATFDVSFIIDERLVGISNGDVIEEKSLENGQKRVKFRRTPKMSTYLLFFGIGDFQFLEDRGKKPEDILIRVATLPGKKKHGRYALSFARKVLNYCQKYFLVPYPLKKLDNIAVPDFAFGAMENWGAILYREDAMLFDRKTTSFRGKKRISEVIAHEIAHQWFGNLVSPLKWKYIWLNESFATWFAYKIVSSLYPKWKLWNDFILGQTVGALYRDSYLEDVPIELPGDDDSTPEFNLSIIPIIYNKGGTILRMLEDYLGEKSFREGLRYYMKKHQYGNASSEDLWKALEEVTKEPVVNLMKSWIEQPGFPLINASLEGNELVLHQQRFTYLPNESEQLWIVPIKVKLFYEDASTKIKRFLMKNREKRVKIDGAIAVKVNFGQAGYYRVQYSDDLLKKLGNLILERKLSPIDRWGIHNDFHALTVGGEHALDEYLGFIENYFLKETDYLPAIDILHRLTSLYIYFKNTKSYSKIKAVATMFIDNLLKEIGLEPQPRESPHLSSLRQDALSVAVTYELSEVRDFLLEKYQHYKKTGNVHPDLRIPVLLAGASTNDDDEFEWMKERHGKTDLEHERVAFLQGLSAFQKESLIEEYLEFVLKEVPMRNQGRAVGFIAMNPAAHQHVWPWFKEHQPIFQKIHPNIHESMLMAIIWHAFFPYKDEIAQLLTEYMNRFPRFKDSIKLGLEIMEVTDKFIRSNS